MEFLNHFSSIQAMGAKDMFNYVIFDNPVSKTMLSPFLGKASDVPISKVQVISEHVPLWKLVAEQGHYVRIAGILGASAVMLGAYGAHKKYPKDSEIDLKAVYTTANTYHFIHTLAILGTPLCRYPHVTGTLLLLGTTLFCGTCYYRAFTGNNKYGHLAPVGGTLLIFAWLSMVL